MKDFFNSNFPQPEWAAAFRKDPQGKARQLIPLRIAECEPEGLLGPISGSGKNSSGRRVI